MKTFMTKPGNAARFGFGRARVFANEADIERIMQEIVLPERSGSILFLDEEPALALTRAAVGKNDYNPRLDIDRYCVTCVELEPDAQACPVWEKLKSFVRDEGPATWRADFDPDDGHGIPLIGDGDGRVGRCAAKSDIVDEWRKLLAKVGEECRKCEHCGKKRKESAQKVEKRGHGGIISFFRRFKTRPKAVNACEKM